VQSFSGFLLLIVSLTVSGQTLPDSLKTKQQSILKWSPFHLVGFYPTVQLAYELRYNENQSIQLDAGYVINLERNNERFKNLRGTKLKVEWRYYLDPAHLARRRYLSLEPYTNLINFDRTEFNTECFDVACQVLYTREYNYMVRYRETGVSFKLGLQKQLQRFVFDVNYGLMLRDINYKKPEIPRGFNEEDFVGWFSRNEDKRVVFGPVVGLRLGYRLSKEVQ
jgi:hypothetical protein